MKLSNILAIFAISASTAQAELVESSVEFVIASLESKYGSNAQLESWAKYVSTHSFTTPLAVATYLANFATITDNGAYISALNDAPTEITEFISQYYPGSILAVVSSLTALSTGNDDTKKSTSTSSNGGTGSTSTSSNGGTGSTALPVGAAVGLSGLIAALVWY